MVNWTSENLNAYNTRQASHGDSGSESKGAEPKRIIRHESVGQAPRKEGYPNRFKVSIVSYRKRLIDPDNLCPKYFIDALRYEGLIPDDTAREIVLEVRQEKAVTKCFERTVIEITPIT